MVAFAVEGEVAEGVASAEEAVAAVVVSAEEAAGSVEVVDFEEEVDFAEAAFAPVLEDHLVLGLSEDHRMEAVVAAGEPQAQFQQR